MRQAAARSSALGVNEEDIFPPQTRVTKVPSTPTAAGLTPCTVIVSDKPAGLISPAGKIFARIC